MESISPENIQFTISEATTRLPSTRSPIPPPIIFIVPYRDREQQYHFFKKQMAHVLEGIEHKIFYIHQKDNRGFNRGALKNIGFLVVRKLYPNNYRNITLVFNDIDTMPFTPGFLNYHTTPGQIKHFYGFKFALGGIVSINAGDFEKINGFPNFWTWGYEDNMLKDRAEQHGLVIDRSHFYPLLDKNILYLQDGTFRQVNRNEYDRYSAKTNEGWKSITNLQYEIDSNSEFVHVSSFDTGIAETTEKTFSYDLRNGPKPFQPAKKPRMTKMGMIM
jgi:N-terminal region of glycosyl transferase group 7/N-terminal domain of galactosyltransferase